MTPLKVQDRTEINRANSQHSTGPRTAAGKQRSSLNALRHGLTSRSPVLPSEDPAAYQQHLQQFLDEYKPATPTETHLVHDLANTAWRQNRVPLLEAELLGRTGNIVASHQALATLGLHGHRLSRQFERTLLQLRDLQAERRQQTKRELKRAAALLEMHKHKQIPWDPGQDGFDFSKEQIQAHSDRLMRHNQSRHFERPAQDASGSSEEKHTRPTRSVVPDLERCSSMPTPTC